MTDEAAADPTTAKRIYTAFISSTYRDLAAERRRVSDELQGIRILTLGMETFPSTGEGQWALIEECVEIADFCVFIVAGRYGSIDPLTGLSWTQREYRYAVSKGKRCVILVHSDWETMPSALRETDPDRIASLRAFHAELAESGMNHVRYSSTDELIGGLHRSVNRLIEQEYLEGWMRPSDTLNIQIAYDAVSVRARFSPSQTVPDTLDLEYQSRRVIRGRQLGGLNRLPVTWSRPNDEFLPFGPHNHPVIKLSRSDRSEAGEVRVMQRKAAQASFAFDLVFDPPLRFNEVADVDFSVGLKGYEYAFAEDRRDATRNSVEGVQDFGQWVWTLITRPTREFEMVVEVAQAAVRKVRGLSMSPTLRQWSSRERSNAEAAAEYHHEVFDLDGQPFDRMRVKVRNPLLRTNYVLSWDLPHRTDD